MEFDKCINTMQNYLANSPLIILGSGASISYGLPSMGDLAEYIRNSDEVKTDPEYNAFCLALSEIGLEKAIDRVSLKTSTITAIRKTTWEVINNCDANFLKSNNFSPPYALTELIKKVIEPTPNKAVVVTTNYDRLSEYAADGIGASIVTGFEGVYIKKFELPNLKVKNTRIKVRERIVDIWKVHGSLDWFIDSKKETIVSIPFLERIPSEFSPLIVPPGKNKYSITHEEPYRTIISEADKAFEQAGSYLCIGYGFNDEHIQPKLLEQIKLGKPIVILAREMTEACKKHIINSDIQKYMIFERADNTNTKIYGNNCTKTYKGQYWCLDEFIKIW